MSEKEQDHERAKQNMREPLPMDNNVVEALFAEHWKKLEQYVDGPLQANANDIKLALGQLTGQLSVFQTKLGQINAPQGPGGGGFKGLMNDLKSLADNLIPGVTGGLDGIRQKLDDLGTAAKNNDWGAVFRDGGPFVVGLQRALDLLGQIDDFFNKINGTGPGAGKDRSGGGPRDFGGTFGLPDPGQVGNLGGTYGNAFADGFSGAVEQKLQGVFSQAFGGGGGSAGPLQPLLNAFNNVVDTMANAVNANLGPKIKTAFDTMAADAATAWNAVVAVTTTGAQLMNQAFAAGIASMANTSMLGMLGVIVSINGAFTAIQAVVAAGMVNLNATWVGGWLALSVTAAVSFPAIVLVVAAGMAQIVAAVVSGMLVIQTAFMTGWLGAIASVASGMASIVATVVAGMGSMTAVVTTGMLIIMTAVITGVAAIRAAFAAGWATIIALTRSAMGAFILAISTGVSQAVALFRGLVSQITGALGGLASALYSAGVSAMQGFINGIRSQQGAAVAAAVSVANAATAAFKANLQIHSPSRVFRDIGENVMKGFQRGLEGGYSAVESSLKGFGDDLAGSGLSGHLRGLVDGSHEGPVIEQKILNYHAAPGNSLSSEDDLFAATGRTRFGW